MRREVFSGLDWSFVTVVPVSSVVFPVVDIVLSEGLSFLVRKLRHLSAENGVGLRRFRSLSTRLHTIQIDHPVAIIAS